MHIAMHLMVEEDASSVYFISIAIERQHSSFEE